MNTGSRQSTESPSTIQIELLTFEPSSVYAVTNAVRTLGAENVIYSDGSEGKVRAT